MRVHAYTHTYQKRTPLPLPSHPTKTIHTHKQNTQAMLQLGQTIMRGFALGFGLPEGYFAPHYARSFWCMRIIR